MAAPKEIVDPVESDQLLYNRLYYFLKRSIPILKEKIKLNPLPTQERYSFEMGKRGPKFIKQDCPNWSKIKDLLVFSDLPGWHEAYNACIKHTEIQSRKGQSAMGFNSGLSFTGLYIPDEFLIELVIQENNLRFNKKTFEKIFLKFIDYIYSRPINAKVIVPLSHINAIPRLIELDKTTRIRSLNPQEFVDLLNRFEVLNQFYCWPRSFRCVLELNVPFKWSWENSTSGSTSSDRRSQNPLVIKSIINQEMVLLRSILMHGIASPTYVIDNMGWNSSIRWSGLINELSWVYFGVQDQLPLTLKEARRYVKICKKFLDIENTEDKQRIFVAARKLSASMNEF